jgi:hypothetical protein
MERDVYEVWLLNQHLKYLSLMIHGWWLTINHSSWNGEFIQQDHEWRVHHLTDLDRRLHSRSCANESRVRLLTHRETLFEPQALSNRIELEIVMIVISSANGNWRKMNFTRGSTRNDSHVAGWISWNQAIQWLIRICVCEMQIWFHYSRVVNFPSYVSPEAIPEDALDSRARCDGYERGEQLRSFCPFAPLFSVNSTLHCPRFSSAKLCHISRSVFWLSLSVWIWFLNHRSPRRQLVAIHVFASPSVLFSRYPST